MSGPANESSSPKASLSPGITKNSSIRRNILPSLTPQAEWYHLTLHACLGPATALGTALVCSLSPSRAQMTDHAAQQATGMGLSYSSTKRPSPFVFCQIWVEGPCFSWLQYRPHPINHALRLITHSDFRSNRPASKSSDTWPAFSILQARSWRPPRFRGSSSCDHGDRPFTSWCKLERPW